MQSLLKRVTPDLINPWLIVNALEPVYRVYDSVTERQKYLDRHHHHVGLDVLISRLKAKNMFHPFSFYPNGYGRTDALADVCFDITRSEGGEDSLFLGPAKDVDITLEASRYSNEWAHVANGHFLSPGRGRYIPSASDLCHFQLITPTCWYTGKYHEGQYGRSIAEEMSKSKPMVILLSGTGEQGFMRRRHMVSNELAKIGIGSLIHESPYYGLRRPKEQHASKLSTLMDLLFLGHSTILESFSLIRWLRARDNVSEFIFLGSPSSPSKIVTNVNLEKSGPQIRPPLGADSIYSRSDSALFGLNKRDKHDAIVMGGTSMGGIHSCMAASIIPYPVGVVSWLGPVSASGVFTVGRLGYSMEWDRMIRDANYSPRAETLEKDLLLFEEVSSKLPERPHSHVPHEAQIRALHESVAPESSYNTLRHAVVQASRVLRMTDLTYFGKSRRPDAAIFVRARHDQYVPYSDDIVTMWNDVSNVWNGCDVRVVDGGHVTAAIFQTSQYMQAYIDVIRRLLR